MRAHTHQLVAYTACRLSDPDRVSCSVYDHAADHRLAIDGVADSDAVSLFDREVGAYFGGAGNDGEYTLHHEGSGASVKLKMEGDGRFSGFDFSTGGYFRGSVFGTNVSLYDVSDDRYYNFST